MTSGELDSQIDRGQSLLTDVLEEALIWSFETGQDRNDPALMDKGVKYARAFLLVAPDVNRFKGMLRYFGEYLGDDPAINLERLRLIGAADEQPDGLYDLAAAARDAGSPIEAERALAEYIEKSFGRSPIPEWDRDLLGLRAELRDLARSRRSTLQRRERAMQTADEVLAVADDYFGLGNYRRAAELYVQSGAKGADADLTRMRAGMSLALAGEKEAATELLAEVEGPRRPLAGFWQIWVWRTWEVVPFEPLENIPPPPPPPARA